MEQKSLKTPVYVYENVYENVSEIPVDVDFSLPEYCPDIEKILKCRAVAEISSKGANGNNVSLDGCVHITVLYCDKSGCLKSHIYQYPFGKTFETGLDISSGIVSACAKTDYVNCRAVNARKVDIHGAVSVKVTVKCRKCHEVICDVDDENIELRRGSLPATSPMGYAEKYLITEESIEIGQGQPDIESLLRYDAQVSVRECKLLANKAMVRGELNVTLLYCAVDGSLQTVRCNLPVSQMLEIDGVTEECECDATAQVAFLELKPQTDQSGTAKCFNLNAKILICCEAYCNKDTDVVLDAFSRRYKADIVSCDLSLDKIVSVISDTLNIRQNVNLAANEIKKVCDIWCEIGEASSSISSGELKIKGALIASVITDDGAETSFCEKAFDFEYSKKLAGDSDCLYASAEVTVLNVSYVISGASCLEIRAELNINACISEKTCLPVISELTVDTENKISRKINGAMTIYFANEGEEVWDIARKYTASIEEIKKINDIKNDILTADRMILIPVN